VLIGDPVLCKAAWDELFNRHRRSIFPVPRGTDRLRLMPTPLHSEGGY
jgi:hypothetical protein